MAKFSRDKGKRGERMVAKAFRRIFPEASRDLNDVYAEKGIDLTNTGNLAVQVKHYARHVPLSKFQEIKPADDQIPVLVSWPTSTKEEPLVVLRLEHFLDILENTKIVGKQ